MATPKSNGENQRGIKERSLKKIDLSYLASFPELNPNPVLEVDVKGKINYANPAAKNLFPELFYPTIKYSRSAESFSIPTHNPTHPTHNPTNDRGYSTEQS